MKKCNFGLRTSVKCSNNLTFRKSVAVRVYKLITTDLPVLTFCGKCYVRGGFWWTIAPSPNNMSRVTNPWGIVKTSQTGS